MPTPKKKTTKARTAEVLVGAKEVLEDIDELLVEIKVKQAYLEGLQQGLRYPSHWL